MDEGEHYKLMEELNRKANFKDGKVSQIDGLRVDFEDGFGLIRPSNTTPTLIMRFEARSQSGLEKIQKQFRDLLIATRGSLSLPF